MTVNLLKPPTYEVALRLLKDAIAERGEDFVYHAPPVLVDEFGDPVESDCVYVDPRDDTPSCGVGLAMHNYGVPIETLATEDSYGNGADRMLKNLWPGAFNMSDDVSRLFKRFQVSQDDGVSWGDSLNGAVEFVKEYQV